MDHQCDRQTDVKTRDAQIMANNRYWPIIGHLPIIDIGQLVRWYRPVVVFALFTYASMYVIR